MFICDLLSLILHLQQPFPKKFPFSEFVPKVYSQIKEFIYACLKFSEDLHLRYSMIQWKCKRYWYGDYIHKYPNKLLIFLSALIWKVLILALHSMALLYLYSHGERKWWKLLINLFLFIWLNLFCTVYRFAFQHFFLMRAH